MSVEMPLFDVFCTFGAHFKTYKIPRKIFKIRIFKDTDMWPVADV